MSLRINTNIASLSAQRSLDVSQRRLETTLKQLATGNRFVNSAEGPGDFAVAERLRSQSRGQRAARGNAENATSVVQVAEGALNEQNNILIRMRELAIQASSDTFADPEREMMEIEFQQLLAENERIAQSTRFGSQQLLAGHSTTMEFQVGTGNTSNDIVKFSSDANTTSSGLDIDDLSVADKFDARDSLEYIDDAMVTLAKNRANFGAMQSRLESVVANADVAIENLEAAHSRIADTDFAAASAEMFKQQALQQYQVSVMAQANQYPQSVLRLIA